MKQSLKAAKLLKARVDEFEKSTRKDKSGFHKPGSLKKKR